MLLGLNRKVVTGIMLFLSVVCIHPPLSFLPWAERKQNHSMKTKRTTNRDVTIVFPHLTADLASQSLEARLHQLAVKQDYCFGKLNCHYWFQKASKSWQYWCCYQVRPIRAGICMGFCFFRCCCCFACLFYIGRDWNLFKAFFLKFIFGRAGSSLLPVGFLWFF